MDLLLDASHLEDLRAWMALGQRPAAPVRAAVWDPGKDVVGGVARVKVRGPLSRQLDIWQAFFGDSGTTYGAIGDALELAERDPRVASIDLELDSPGGTVDGLFELIARMNGIQKPMRAVVSDMATSAAYAIACQCDRIVALNPVARFGSVGVVASFWTNDRQVDVTSTDAPDKRPDVRTEQGKAVVRRELDAIHAEFVEAIASGRGVSAATVNAIYGRGAVLLARDALAAGMIDDLIELKSSEQGTHTMKNLEDLRAQHPDLYAAAVADGVKQERDRCTAHVVLARGSGEWDAAASAIEAGEGITETVKAKHFAAQSNARLAAARAADKPPVVSATQETNPSPYALSEADLVAQLRARRG